MAKLVKESIDRFYDYDIHTETRTIYIGSVESDIEHGESGTDASMAERAIKALHILDSSAPNGDKPITIIMNNPGGDWYHGMAIYDAIKTCKNHVSVVVYGYAMSMGSIIFQAADKRIMSPNSKMMIHYGYNGFDGHSRTFLKVAEESKKIDQVMEDIYLERIKQKNPKFTVSKLREMVDHDTFLTAKEALDLGLIDEILGE
jgi:ATP-dependent Clp endopeptidase proteolytic subunit ClpP